MHIERECLAVFTFAELGCFVKQTKILIFISYSNCRGSISLQTL